MKREQVMKRMILTSNIVLLGKDDKSGVKDFTWMCQLVPFSRVKKPRSWVGYYLCVLRWGDVGYDCWSTFLRQSERASKREIPLYYYYFL